MHNFNDRAARTTVPENDMWCGPCPLLAAWSADDVIDASGLRGAKDERARWEFVKAHELGSRAVFAWNVQLDFTPLPERLKPA